MGEVLDDIGRETAALARTTMQLATLVALRTREHGQKQAEARAQVTDARLKELKEIRLREARDAKNRDPRNRELARLIARPMLDKGVSLERDALARTPVAPAKPLIQHDSPQRRRALREHLARSGVSPDLAAVRLRMDLSQAQPPQAAVRSPQPPPQVSRGPEIPPPSVILQRERP